MDILIRGWESYLVTGGFPAALASYVECREEASALRANLSDVIHGDAFRRADWSRAQTADLLRRLSGNLCTPLNTASVANDIGISRSAFIRRARELREAFVLWPCHREAGMRPKLGAQTKFYFTDPIYTHLGPHPGHDFTRLSQQQLGMALLRASERTSPGAYLDYDRVLFHRTRTRKEIDFVGPGFGGICIESKYTDRNWRRDALTLPVDGGRPIGVAVPAKDRLVNVHVEAGT